MPTIPLRAKVATTLNGALLQEVARLEHSWAFEFDKAALTTSFPWRVVTGGRLVLTSNDDGHQFGLPQPIDAEKEARARLVGHKIIAAAVDAETADLRLTFDNGARLELPLGSVAYETWQLNTSDSCIVAAAEGRLSEARYVGSGVMVGGPWE
jgi:hypothetical protein